MGLQQTWLSGTPYLAKSALVEDFAWNFGRYLSTHQLSKL